MSQQIIKTTKARDEVHLLYKLIMVKQNVYARNISSYLNLIYVAPIFHQKFVVQTDASQCTLS